MDGGEVGLEVLFHLGSSGHVHQRLRERPRGREFFGVVVVHTVGGLASITIRLSRQLYDIAEVHVADLAKIPLTVDGLNGGGIGRVGRRRVYIAWGQGAHSGLDGSETVTNFSPGISGQMWSEGLHQLLIDGK